MLDYVYVNMNAAWGGPMTIHQQFGANLRSQCYNYASISEVCKGIDINRQQFNKYLAGQSIPNTSTLSRICDFLKIKEEELFAGRPNKFVSEIDVTAAVAKKPPVDESDRDEFGAILNSINSLTKSTLGSACGALLPGYYNCFFPLHGNDNFLMRSLVRIVFVRNSLRYSRITAIPSRPGSYLAQGKHSGLALANSHEIYFWGINKNPPHNMNFMSFERTNNGMPRLLSGLCITRTTTKSISTKVCLQYLDSVVDVRRLFKELGPVSIESATLEPLVLSMMLSGRTTETNQILPTPFDYSIAQSPVALARYSIERSAQR